MSTRVEDLPGSLGPLVSEAPFCKLFVSEVLAARRENNSMEMLLINSYMYSGLAVYVAARRCTAEVASARRGFGVTPSLDCFSCS